MAAESELLESKEEQTDRKIVDDSAIGVENKRQKNDEKNDEEEQIAATARGE